VLVAAALYAGLAFELEDSRGATLLPTLRTGTGRSALAGNLADERPGFITRQAYAGNCSHRPQ
jgi:hypothetical protein